MEQKDVVARMVELGDKGINTNQVSRYEGGEGPMPRESRLEAFASALETTVAELLAGPPEQREKPKTPDPFAPGSDSEQFRRIEEQLIHLRADLAELGVDFARDEAQRRKWRRRVHDEDSSAADD